MIALSCLALVLTAPFYRAAHSGNDIFYLYANPACFDAIAIGCLTAMLSQHWAPQGRTARVLGIAAGLALAACWVRGFGGSHKILGFTCVSLAAAMVILASLDGRQARPGAWRPVRGLRWLGRHSYELYLFHIIILAALRDAVPGGTLAPGWQIPWLLAFLTASCLAAGAVARLLGEPANRLLRRALLPPEPARCVAKG